MSRSYKKQPFVAICGGASAKKDKVLAHRGERSAHRHAIYGALRAQEFDDFLLPLRLECSHNDVWGWCRDGRQRYTVPTSRDWHDHLKALDPETHCGCLHMVEFYKKHDSVWPPAYYVEMMRK